MTEPIVYDFSAIAARLREITREERSTLLIGEHITCVNGHHICTVVDTIRFADRDWPEKLGNWQMPPPKLGTHPVCHICGADFWSGYGGALGVPWNILHVKYRGWVGRHAE